MATTLIKTTSDGRKLEVSGLAILFDGQDTRNNSTLDNQYTPPMETVEEVRFITNSFSAEYSRSAGGVLVAAGRPARTTSTAPRTSSSAMKR